MSCCANLPPFQFKEWVQFLVEGPGPVGVLKDERTSMSPNMAHCLFGSQLTQLLTDKDTAVGAELKLEQLPDHAGFPRFWNLRVTRSGELGPLSKLSLCRRAEYKVE